MTLANDVLPQSKEIRDLLLDLLGRDVTLSYGDAWAPLPHDNAVTAEYIDDHDQLAVVVVVDLPFAAYVGSAIGLLPAGGAQDMVKEGRLSSPVIDNVYEILNILSSLFNKEGLDHVRIGNLHGPGGPLAGDLNTVVRRLTGRMDVKVDVQGYGQGRLGFVLPNTI
ncbi:MAG: hypothetical protein ACTHMS_00930 [Jatrophihabitans sp.]|uniref:hypothetical protein n=1 Tax=Jatrophihabitans sp. TaxID=1932789 RepID=UPI003F806FE7